MNRSPFDDVPPGVTLRCDDVRMMEGDGENLLGEVDCTLCRFRDGVFVGVRNGEADIIVLFVLFRVGRGGVFIDG